MIRRVAGRLGLLALGCVPMAAQVPSVVATLKGTDHVQAGPSALELRSVLFAVGVIFPAPPPAGTTVALRSPTGATETLVRNSAGEYELFREFPNAEELEARFPDGVFAFTVGGAAAPATYNIAVFSGAPIPPVAITNFAQLQALTAGEVTIQWADIRDARTGDFLELTVSEGERELFATPDSFAPTSRSVFVRNLPFGPVLRGELGYARVSVAVVNNGATAVRTGRAFHVEFPLRVAATPPVFSRQPVAQVADPGATVTLEGFAGGSPTPTLQWKKDGVPIAGATGPTLALRDVTLSSAGTYILEATNLAGTATSQPAVVAIAPTMRYAVHAGSGRYGSADGPANVARFASPRGIARDRAGNLYVVDQGNSVIRKITPTGDVSTFAGLAGARAHVDGPVATARFQGPHSIGIDSVGNIYVSEFDSHTIRVISPDGIVSTLAGAPGARGGADGVGANARFGGPAGLAVGPDDRIYVAEMFNHTVRVITRTGVVSTLAGLEGQSGLVDGAGREARFNYPAALAIDPGGRIYVGESLNAGIRAITPAGRVTTLAVSSSGVIDALACAADGTVYVASGSGYLSRMTPEGIFLGGPFYAALHTLGLPEPTYFSPRGLVVGPTGELYVTDWTNAVVLRATMINGSGNPAIAVLKPPQAHTIAPGARAILAVEATGPNLGFVWRRNGVPIPGNYASTLVLSGADTAESADYSVVVQNRVGFTITSPVRVTVAPTADVGRLINLSIRSQAGTGAQTLIVGVVLGGAPGSSAKRLLIRGIGPSLESFGVTDPVTDPAVSLFAGSQMVNANDDWGGLPVLAATSAAVGAFPLPAGSRDAAIVGDFGPGGYSVQVTSRGGEGVALAEIYDAATGAPASGPRLINVSARALAGGPAGPLIAGFVIGGATSKTVLVRGVGSGLATFGLTGTLPDARLELFAGNASIARNDNWGSEFSLRKAAEEVGAFPLSSSTDAALMLTLPPGAYSAQVSGSGDTRGVALVEVYELP